MIRYSTERPEIDWERAATVFERAPLGRARRDPARLKRAFDASFAVAYAFEDDELIGMARAICDGEYQAAVCDVVLLPEYQGKGVGREMMRVLLGRLPVDNVILWAVPGREGFYRKLGFRRMLTAMAVLRPDISVPGAGYLEP